MHFSPVFASLFLALIGTPVYAQSSTTTSSESSSESQSSSSQSSTSSSSQPSASGVQPPGPLISNLQSAGFGGFAGALNNISGSPEGNSLFSRLQNNTGNNSFLVFAPADYAIQNLPSSVSQNASLLADYLSYHFVQGQFNTTNSTNSTSGGGPLGGGGGSSSFSFSGTPSFSGGPFSSTQGAFVARATGLFGRIFVPRQVIGGGNNSSGNGTQPIAGVWPNVTIGRTLLNSSDLVQLEGNRSQVLVWDTNSPGGNVTILNQGYQGQNITVQNAVQLGNFLIAGINGTLYPPGNLTTALTAVNATVAQNVLQSVQVPSANGTNTTVIEALQSAQGLTFFVPNNDAFTSQINDTLFNLQQNNNTDALKALLQNHYVNGSTIYSTQIGDGGNVVSAAGEKLQFTNNATGIFVQGSNGTAVQVVRPDVLLSNGVAHIVNGVLFDTNSDSSAAADAFSSASSAATESTSATGPITALVGGGNAPTPAPTSQFSSESSSSSSSTDSSSTATSTSSS